MAAEGTGSEEVVEVDAAAAAGAGVGVGTGAALGYSKRRSIEVGMLVNVGVRMVLFLSALANSPSRKLTFETINTKKSFSLILC